jgi:single-stranded DNA-binding protein
LIEGELAHRKYDDKGVTKYITEVVIKDLRMHGARPKTAAQNQTDSPASEPSTADQNGYSDAAFGS